MCVVKLFFSSHRGQEKEKLEGTEHRHTLNLTGTLSSVGFQMLKNMSAFVTFDTFEHDQGDFIIKVLYVEDLDDSKSFRYVFKQPHLWSSLSFKAGLT